MKIKLLKVSMLCVLFFSTSHLALADGGYLGGVLGLQAPSESELKSRFGYGLDGGYVFDEGFSVGGNFSLSSKVIHSVPGTGELSASLSTFHVHGRYFAWEGLYLGVGLGFTTVGVDVKVGSYKASLSNTEFSFAPQIGYDYKVAEELSLGVALDYVVVPETTDTVNGVTIMRPSFQIFNALASIKFWF